MPICVVICDSKLLLLLRLHLLLPSTYLIVVLNCHLLRLYKSSSYLVINLLVIRAYFILPQFLCFIYKILNSKHIIFSSLYPSIIMSSSRHRMFNFVRRIFRCIKELISMLRWYNLIVHSYNKKNWNFNVAYPLERRPYNP